MAKSICDSFQNVAARLMDLGLGYLTLDRSSSTLSTGERQRMQLAAPSATGRPACFMCWMSPSIGLHPANIVGLIGVMRDLIADGNSVILVDHDTQILSQADWMIEMGPQAGANGGYVIAQGSLADIAQNPASRIAPFLSEKASLPMRRRARRDELFALGRIHLSTRAIHTVKPLDVDIPKGRLTVVTGVSGSGKTTLVLESLVPALAAKASHSALPDHVRALDAEGIAQVKLIDATPSASMSARPLRPTPTSTMNCARYSPERRMPSGSATRRAISPTTPASCAVRCATERAKSVWMFSSCRMWIFLAPSAAARVTAATRNPSATKANRAPPTPCPN